MHLRGLHSTEQSSIIKNMIAERTYSSTYSHKKSAKSFVKILDIGKLIRQNPQLRSSAAPQLRSSAAPQLSNSSVHINSQSNTYTFSHVIERIKARIVPLCVFFCLLKIDGYLHCCFVKNSPRRTESMPAGVFLHACSLHFQRFCHYRHGCRWFQLEQVNPIDKTLYRRSLYDKL